MQHLQKRPQVSRTDGAFFLLTYYRAQLLKVVNGLPGDQSWCVEPTLEIVGIPRGARAFKQTHEIAQQDIRSSLHDKREAVMVYREAFRALEISPEIQNGLLTLLIGRTDCEGPFYLTGESTSHCASAFTGHQEIIRTPTQALGLKTDLDDIAVDQNRRDRPNEQLREPVSPHVLLEERSGPSGR